MVNQIRKKGFTLVEVMISIAILGVIFSFTPNMILQIRRFFFLSDAKASLQRDARDVMYVITRRLRQARASSIVIDQLSGHPYYSRLSFSDVDGNNITYYQQGTNLFMIDGGTRTLTKDLRYIAFSAPRSDDLGIISLSFTLEKGTYEGRTKALHMASEKVRLMN